MKLDFTPAFQRDVKALARKNVNLSGVTVVLDLLSCYDREALEVLRRRHRAHKLSGRYANVWECHVENAGDLLLLWNKTSDVVVLMRLGTHDQLF